MERIVLFVLIGLGAQLVDGTLGMAFGVTATTLFILSDTGAATASAVVHVVEVGTTLASGASHWRFGNVDWGRALRLGVPGAIGAFLGATFLSSLDGDAAKPVTSTILLALGLWVLVRFAFLPPRRNVAAASWGLSKLGPLGLAGGLLDATGGGGWGPVTTSTMLSAGADQPRKIIGTVSAAEFLVTVAATLGFLPLLREEFAEHTLPILGLLVGGVLAAPIAAFLVGRINPRTLGIVIGGVLVLLNLRTLFGTVTPLLLGWVAVVAVILVWSRSHDTLPWLRHRVTLDPVEEKGGADEDAAAKTGAARAGR